MIFSPWLGTDPDGNTGLVGVQITGPVLIVVDDVGPAPAGGYLDAAIGGSNSATLAYEDTIQVLDGSFTASTPITDGVTLLSQNGAEQTTINGSLLLNSANVIIGRMGNGFSIHSPIAVGAGVDASTIHINWNDIYAAVANSGAGWLDATYNYWGANGPDTVGLVNVYPYLPVTTNTLIGYVNEYGYAVGDAITFAELLVAGTPLSEAELIVLLTTEFGLSTEEAAALINEYGRAEVNRAAIAATDLADLMLHLVGYATSLPSGGAGGGAGGDLGGYPVGTVSSAVPRGCGSVHRRRRHGCVGHVHPEPDPRRRDPRDRPVRRHGVRRVSGGIHVRTGHDGPCRRGVRRLPRDGRRPERDLQDPTHGVGEAGAFVRRGGWASGSTHLPPSGRKEGMKRAAFLAVVLVVASSAVALATTADFPGGTLDVSWVDDAMLSIGVALDAATPQTSSEPLVWVLTVNAFRFGDGIHSWQLHLSTTHASVVVIPNDFLVTQQFALGQLHIDASASEPGKVLSLLVPRTGPIPELIAPGDTVEVHALWIQQEPLATLEVPEPAPAGAGGGDADAASGSATCVPSQTVYAQGLPIRHAFALVNPETGAPVDRGSARIALVRVSEGAADELVSYLYLEPDPATGLVAYEFDTSNLVPGGLRSHRLGQPARGHGAPPDRTRLLRAVGLRAAQL